MAAADQEPLGREVWIVAGVMLLGIVMSILDTTIVTVALDTLSRELNADLDAIQWVVTGYLLALSAVIPLTGWLSERFGAKQVWIGAVVAFTACSALCGLAWSVESLIAFRILQGLAGGVIMPVGMSLMTQTAGPDRLGRVMAVLGVPTLLAPVFGPVIGGLIVEHFSWQWIFYVNVPVGILATVLALRLLDADAGKTEAGKLDWVGFLLLSPGVASVVFGLAESETHGGFTAAPVYGPIAAGLVLIGLFVHHALRAERPLIDVRLFRNRTVRYASMTQFLLGGALFGAMIVLPLYYQVARGEGALAAGLLLAPQGVGAALAMPIAGRLTDRYGGGALTVIGLVITLLATVPLAFIGPDTSYALLSVVLVVRGVGIAAAMMPSLAAAYSALSALEVPRATSALSVIQRVGGTVGTAVLAVVLQGEINDRLGNAGGGRPTEIPDRARELVAAPLADAFAATFWWAVAATAVGVVPAVLLARAERAARRARKATDAGAPAPVGHGQPGR